MLDPQGKTLPASNDSLATQRRESSPSTGLGVAGNAPVAGELGARYDMGDTIGRGGMGEVRIARDTRISREVAVKLMRSQEPSEQEMVRFFREARVQGVLEHPAVVPVHDLGIDPKSGPYFVMKRLAGITLADVIASTNEAIRTLWPRKAMLTRLVTICYAVDLAHTRGVIHRDVKPANIMLGDYGDAYLLDWGLARVEDEADTLDGVMPLSGDDPAATQAGALLGTPGYMSPEQARGDYVGPPTDVFALGMTLYEVLAGRPALGRGLDAVAETLVADSFRPRERGHDVPIELDTLCARATSADPKKRPTARELADAIQAYLNGDRDHEARKSLAQQHALLAQRALAAVTSDDVLSSQVVRDSTDSARATATREAGRALALDPTNVTAGAILAKLMIEAPTTIPAEALAHSHASRAEARRALFAAAQHSFAGLIGLTLGVFLLGPRHIWPVLLAAVLATGMWLISRHLARYTVDGTSGWFVILAVLTALLLGWSGAVFGPILILPAYMIGTIAAFLSQPTDFRAWIPIALLSSPIVIVAVLEYLGVLPPTTTFVNGAVVITSPLVDLTPIRTILLVGASIGSQIVNTAFVFVSAMRVQRESQDRLHAQRWHLERLIPMEDVTTTVPQSRSKRPTKGPS